MADQTFNALILCTGNSARSILAEALINHMSARAGLDIQAFSAGSRPKLEVHPEAIGVPEGKGHQHRDVALQELGRVCAVVSAEDGCRDHGL